jgi:hypothetical protein
MTYPDSIGVVNSEIRVMSHMRIWSAGISSITPASACAPRPRSGKRDHQRDISAGRRSGGGCIGNDGHGRPLRGGIYRANPGRPGIFALPPFRKGVLPLFRACGFRAPWHIMEAVLPPARGEQKGVFFAMPHPQFDRHELHVKPLSARKDKVYIEQSHVLPDAPVAHPFTGAGEQVVRETVERVKRARETGKSRMLTFGAHSIKNASPRSSSSSWRTLGHPPRHQRRGHHPRLGVRLQGHSSEDVRPTWTAASSAFGRRRVLPQPSTCGWRVARMGYASPSGLRGARGAGAFPRSRPSSTRSTSRPPGPRAGRRAADLLDRIRTLNWIPADAVPPPTSVSASSRRLPLGIPFTSHP